MDFKLQVQAIVNELVDNGKVAEMIQAHIEKSVNATLESIFREYSDFGKDLKSALSNSLNLAFDKLNLDQYQLLVMQTIENCVNNTILAQHKERIEKSVRVVLQQLEKKNWKLSEICEKYKHQIYRSEGDRFGFEYEERSYGHYITIGEIDTNRSSAYSNKINKDYTIHMSRQNEVRCISVDNGRTLSSLTGDAGSFAAFMMQLWAAGCTIEVDHNAAEAICCEED